MKKSIQTALLVITLVSFNFSQAFLDISKEELKSRSAALTSKGTHRRLSRAHSLLGKDKINDALEVLKRLEKSTASRPHELAQVLQAMGHAYAQKDQFGKAINYMKKSLELKALPYGATLSTLYMVGQIQVSQEKYSEALKTVNLWFKLADEPSPEAYVLKATIFAQMKKEKAALELVTKAIDMTKKPQESWLAFAVAMNYQLERFKEAGRLLEKLTGMYPQKKKYWKQLTGVYLNLEENKKALATMELAEKGNYLEQDSEIMNLVSLFIYGGIPLKGAKLLEKSLKEGKVKKSQKNYEILGDAWVAAEEMDKGLEAYAQSAKMAGDGRIFAKQGRIYLEQENWDKASEYLSQGLKKGNIRNPQHVHMALGVARFNLKKFDAASASFEAAKKASKKVERQADQWIEYTKTEDKRLNPEKYAKADEEDEMGSQAL
jgi:uncharacterized protein HemY